ncbi:MAG: hypothetical protein ACE5E6_00005 [Phycisphaerae bacterium]
MNVPERPAPGRRSFAVVRDDRTVPDLALDRVPHLAVEPRGVENDRPPTRDLPIRRAVDARGVARCARDTVRRPPVALAPPLRAPMKDRVPPRLATVCREPMERERAPPWRTALRPPTRALPTERVADDDARRRGPPAASSAPAENPHAKASAIVPYRIVLMCVITQPLR